MKISKDVENMAREALVANGITAYCRPLPKNYGLPNILISEVGGNQMTDWSETPHLDVVDLVLDARAHSEAEALELRSAAVGALQSSGAFRSVTVNSRTGWGTDPVRPDLAMCSVRIRVRAGLVEVQNGN